MSDPVSHLKQELLAAAERQQGDTVLAPKSRRRWLERSRAVPGRRRRLVVVLAAVALATAVTTAGWAIVREVVHDESFVSLPPVGATPSAPESGELVIQYRDLGHPGTGWGWVYADGRLITADARPVTATEPLRPARGCKPLVERTRRAAPHARGRRAPAVRGRLDRTLRAPRACWQVVLPTQRDPGADRRPVGSRQAKGASDEFPKRLRERLTNPASWLPASAWADRRIRAYVASRYEIWYRAQPQTLERSRILSLLPATAEDLLRAKDAVTAHGDIGNAGLPASSGHRIPLRPDNRGGSRGRPSSRRCRAAGPSSFEIPGTSVDPAPPEKGPVRNVVCIGFSPYLPHGETVCLACG